MIKPGYNISEDWINKTNAKPTKIALGVVKNELRLLSRYWEGDDGGCWDDENILSIANIFLDLPKKLEGSW